MCLGEWKFQNNGLIPQSRCQCTLRRCALIWACFDSTLCTCLVSVPGYKARTQLQHDQMYTSKTEVGNSLLTNLFEKEWSQSVRVLQTFLQLPEEETERERGRKVKEISYCASASDLRKLCIICMWAPRTLCASRRSGGYYQTWFCLSLSYHQGHPPPSSGSCSPYVGDTHMNTNLQQGVYKG